MVNVMFISAWGPYPARAQVEIDERQAEPLLATGVAVLVEVPTETEPLPPVVQPEPEAPPAPVARSRKK